MVILVMCGLSPVNAVGLLMITRRDFIAGLGVAVAPFAAEAQPSGATVIGYLDWNAPRSPYVEALRAGLAEAGFIEGRSLLAAARSAWKP
jgi:hypothetical protein